MQVPSAPVPSMSLGNFKNKGKRTGSKNLQKMLEIESRNREKLGKAPKPLKFKRADIN